MRIAELSERTGVPVATIKYYLREGLLPAGRLTSPNQARYDDSHVHRVRLVRALVEVGALSIATTREVLASMSGQATVTAVGKAHFAVTPRVQTHEDDAHRAGVEATTALIERRGWQVRRSNPARGALAEVLAHASRLGMHDLLGLIDNYADAAEGIAEVELAVLADRPDVDSMAEAAVTMSVLGDALLAALRRLAQESAAERHLA